jgi:hypothetical protein
MTEKEETFFKFLQLAVAIIGPNQDMNGSYFHLNDLSEKRDGYLGPYLNLAAVLRQEITKHAG